MLEGLDEIDWKRVHHAYGAADDVPQLLRTLLSHDRNQRYHAAHELFGNIWHQGTVYEATAHAVPFLIELLHYPSTPDHSTVAMLLACIASGCGYLEVHARSARGQTDWRKILDREGKNLDDELERERLIRMSVRYEASKGVPLLIPFLSDPEPEVRSAVAKALGAFPEHRDTHLQILNQALESETDLDVREEIEESINLLRST